MKPNGTQSVQYKNCVSLGPVCSVAGSLTKLGARSCSGPFDWIISSCLEAVIFQIENNFKEYMIKDNLEIVESNKKHFRDTKYGFYYNHDVESDFEKEYPTIYAKYMRRVDRFMKMINNPTVFYRGIWDEAETEYINNNWEHIDRLLKGFNPQNRIVYVCHSGIKGLRADVKVFNLNIDDYWGNTYEMRHMFDKNPELTEFTRSLLSTEQMQKNKEFDITRNLQRMTAAYVNQGIEENVDGWDNTILDSLNASADDGIYLWGAGKYGIPLAKYLRNRGVVINGIIDNKKTGEMIDNFKIRACDTIPNGAKIFIAISDKESNINITNQIRKLNINTCIARYEDLWTEEMDI